MRKAASVFFCLWTFYHLYLPTELVLHINPASVGRASWGGRVQGGAWWEADSPAPPLRRDCEESLPGPAGEGVRRDSGPLIVPVPPFVVLFRASTSSVLLLSL